MKSLNCKKYLLAAFAVSALFSPLNILQAEEKVKTDDKIVFSQYMEYHERLSSVKHSSDLTQYGFSPIEDQTFSFQMKEYGDVSMIPALDRTYHRLILFFSDNTGQIISFSDQLAANNYNIGQMEQPCRGIAAVSFRDLNKDGFPDIILIASCVIQNGPASGAPFKVGDVLFGNGRGFYRDYRISDKINRFGMNQSAEVITAFVRDGHSTEFLYTSSSLNDLSNGGFCVIQEQCYDRSFEKLGILQVAPGTYRISDYDIFMIFLADQQGNIVSVLQPMGDYESLYSLKGISCRDIDGDGMKDIVILARYNYEDTTGQTLTASDYAVYYQRIAGFTADTDMKASYRINDNTTMEELVKHARAYWGWKSEK